MKGHGKSRGVFCRGNVVFNTFSTLYYVKKKHDGGI